MTRRLAIAILLTVWATLIAGGVVAYTVTRSLLLDYLDESLFAYAASVPGIVHAASGQTPALTSLGGDRFLVVDELSRTVARPAPATTAATEPRLVSASFSYAQGQHLRTVTVRAWAVGANPADPPRPVSVIYTRSAAAFDARMHRLIAAFGVFAVAAGLLTAGVAMRVSRAALRPLSRTANQIAAIDETQLDRRLDPAALPPELAPMAERLNEMLARLETAFAARRRFMADASHELRTPVAALVTGLEVSLRHPRDAEAYRRTMQACLGDARQLRQLVERLMEQVRSENLSHDEPMQDVDVTELLNRCADTFGPLLELKRITLRRSLAADLKARLAPGRLRSIATNLLGNATEYAQAGGKIELTSAVDAERDAFTLRVADDGPGIAEEHLPHVFEPFFRAERSRQHGASEGTGQHLGLGLSLVRAHVQAMRGTCEVASRLGEGTVFTVSLPMNIAAPAATNDEEVVSVTAMGQPMCSHGGLIQAG